MALAAGLAQPAIVRARGVLECESERKSMSVAAGVWWRDVLGGMIRGLGGYCSGGASRELGWSPEASIEIGIARVLLAFRHPRKGVASFGIWAVFQPFSGTFWHFRSS